MKLHIIEQRRLAKTGKAELWRPIEPQPHRPGDILATDGGPVRVVKVEAKKIVAVLSDETRWCWRVEVEVVGE